MEMIIISLYYGLIITMMVLVFGVFIMLAFFPPIDIPEEEKLKDYQGYRILLGIWLVISSLVFIYFNVLAI